MFTRDQLREALCILAMQSLHRNDFEIHPKNVFMRIYTLCRAMNTGLGSVQDTFSIMADDANIHDARNITSTVRRLLAELGNPPTPIL